MIDISWIFLEFSATVYKRSKDRAQAPALTVVFLIVFYTISKRSKLWTKTEKNLLRCWIIALHIWI